MNSKPGVLKLIKTEPRGLNIGDIYKEQGTTQLFICSVEGITGTYPVVLPIIVTDGTANLGQIVCNTDNEIFTVDTIEDTSNGDKIVNCGASNFTESWLKDCKPVLVFTPQIPQNIIDAIVAGKLKDGDAVSVNIGRRFDEDKIEEYQNSIEPFQGKIVAILQEGKAIVSIPVKNEYMKKLDISALVCTIEQGKRLDELLDRTGQYSDNLFHHVVFCPDPLGEQWYYEVCYSGCTPNELEMPGEIVCNAYCDGELDQLLPGGTFKYRAYIDEDREVMIKHCRIGDFYYSDIHIIGTTDSLMPHVGMETSAQSKAQCLIWLIENTGYKPQNQ